MTKNNLPHEKPSGTYSRRLEQWIPVILAVIVVFLVGMIGLAFVIALGLTG